MAKIKLSSWTYAPVGAISAEQAAKDLKELGLTHPMSLTFDYKTQDKGEFIRFLDECYTREMSVIVADERADFRRYQKVGEEEYRKSVEQMVADFGSHPAIYGFHVGDEPSLADMEAAIRAIQICNEYTPDLTNFINLLPYYEGTPEDLYGGIGAKSAEEYTLVLGDFIRRSGIKVLSYDCYAHCCCFDKEHYKNIYFENLRIFQKAAKENNVELFTSLLSVGHMSLRVPTEDDIRWQISTAVTSGVTGILWFFIYERTLDRSFRNAPIDLFYERTQTYEFLSRQNRIFLKFHAKHFEDAKFLWCKHYGGYYGGFEKFEWNDDLQYVEVAIGKAPVSVSKFELKDGRTMYALVNLNQVDPAFIKTRWHERFGGMPNKKDWLAPGEMMLFISKN